MTEADERKRKLLQTRTAEITIARLQQMAIIDDCQIGEIVDRVIESEYNTYVALGKVRNHLLALQSIENATYPDNVPGKQE